MYLLSTAVLPAFESGILVARKLTAEAFLALLSYVTHNLCGHSATDAVLRKFYPNLPLAERGFWTGDGGAIAARPRGGFALLPGRIMVAVCARYFALMPVVKRCSGLTPEQRFCVIRKVMNYIDDRAVERLNNEVRELLASGECDDAMYALRCVIFRNRIQIVEETESFSLGFLSGLAVNIWWEGRFGYAHRVTIDNFDGSGVGFNNQPLDSGETYSSCPPLLYQRLKSVFWRIRN